MRWGFVGASGIAQRVAACLRGIDAQVLAGVCSRSAARAAAFAAEHGFAGHHDDVDAFLREGRFDAVYVSSTNDRHAEQTLAALDAGCHVLCEKPLALTRDDAQRMVARARARGLVLATHHALRGAPAHRLIREHIAAGAIGTVHAVQLSHAVHLRPELQTWRVDAPQAGGGVVLDILVHDADLLRFVLGVEPRRVTAFTQQAGMGRGAVEDGAMAIIEFDGGVLAQVHVSFVAPHAPTTLRVLGTEGCLDAEGSLTSAGRPQLRLHAAGGSQAIDVPAADLHRVSLAAFIEACAGRGSALATGADGERSLAVALAARASAASGRAESID